MEDDAISRAELVEAWRQASKAAELASRVATSAAHALDRAGNEAAMIEEIATLAEEAAVSADRAAAVARRAAAVASRDLGKLERRWNHADAAARGARVEEDEARVRLRTSDAEAGRDATSAGRR